jgi:hypothetical protein
VADSDKITGRAGIFAHLYGFPGDPNWAPPYCGISERVFHQYNRGPAVLVNDSHDGNIQRVMEVIQDEYAEQVLGIIPAFKGACLEICGKCPYRFPALQGDKRPINQSYRVFNTKEKAESIITLGLDPLIVREVAYNSGFCDKPQLCHPQFGVITVPDLALGEVRIGRKRFKEAFLAVLSTTLRSPLVDRLLYHDFFSNAEASLASFEFSREIDVL